MYLPVVRCLTLAGFTCLDLPRKKCQRQGSNTARPATCGSKRHYKEHLIPGPREVLCNHDCNTHICVLIYVLIFYHICVKIIICVYSYMCIFFLSYMCNNDHMCVIICLYFFIICVQSCMCICVLIRMGLTHY